MARVTSIADIFRGCSAYNQPLSSWRVGAVTSMDRAFEEAAVFDQDLTSWNVSRVRSLSDMFNDATAFEKGCQRERLASPRAGKNWVSNKAFKESYFVRWEKLTPCEWCGAGEA